MPDFYPENNAPRQGDPVERSLHKVVDLLGGGGGGASVPGINIPAYDYVLLDPPAKPTTITYKTGGAGGTTVATLTLTYVGDDVESVTRS